MSNRTQNLKRLNDLELDLRRRELPGMVGRNEVEAELQQIEKELRELVTAYEQYFIGADRFEPAKERQILTLRLRRMVNIYIPQTDLRFRLQGLASRLIFALDHMFTSTIKFESVKSKGPLQSSTKIFKSGRVSCRFI